MRSARALGGHPKPASRGHLKTGQLQAVSQDILFYPSRSSFASFSDKDGCAMPAV